MDPKAANSFFNTVAMRYDIKVVRDVPSQVFFVVVFFLLLIPPIVVTVRAFKFEGKRWAESDFAPASTSSSSGDDD
jgi:hypothetical protein